MIEKYISPGTMRPVKWILGAIVEVTGIALLFSFDKTISIISQYPVIFAGILIISGYLLAVAGRRK